MGEWLVAAIVSDIQKVIDGTIPFGKELASNSYVQDTGSGFRVVSQGRGPKLVQISKVSEGCDSPLKWPDNPQDYTTVPKSLRLIS